MANMASYVAGKACQYFATSLKFAKASRGKLTTGITVAAIAAPYVGTRLASAGSDFGTLASSAALVTNLKDLHIPAFAAVMMGRANNYFPVQEFLIYAGIYFTLMLALTAMAVIEKAADRTLLAASSAPKVIEC